MTAAEPKLSRYGTFNTWDAMKLLALALMFIDHFGFFFQPDEFAWRALGRGAAPIFLFLTGYAPASRIKSDLAIGAVAMWIINLTAGGGVLPLGILGTIVIGRALIMLLDSGRLKLTSPFEWMAVMLLFLPTMVLFQSGSLGMLFVLCGYLQRHAENYPRQRRLAFFIIAFTVFGLMEWAGMGLGICYSALLAATLLAVGALCWRMRVASIALPAPLRWTEPGLRLLSRYTLWIYVIHFGALQLYTGKHLQI